MYRSSMVLVFVLLFSANIFSQDRYAEPWFDEINTETYTYATKNGEKLDLDIYLPQNDAEFERASNYIYSWRWI